MLVNGCLEVLYAQLPEVVASWEVVVRLVDQPGLCRCQLATSVVVFSDSIFSDSTRIFSISGFSDPLFPHGDQKVSPHDDRDNISACVRPIDVVAGSTRNQHVSTDDHRDNIFACVRPTSQTSLHRNSVQALTNRRPRKHPSKMWVVFDHDQFQQQPTVHRRAGFLPVCWEDVLKGYAFRNNQTKNYKRYSESSLGSFLLEPYLCSFHLLWTGLSLSRHVLF